MAIATPPHAAGCTAAEAAGSLLNHFLGPAVLSMSYAAMLLGWSVGAAIVALGAAMGYTLSLLAKSVVDVTAATGVRPDAVALAELAFGRAAGRALALSLGVEASANGVALLLLVGELLRAAFAGCRVAWGAGAGAAAALALACAELQLSRQPRLGGYA